MTCRTTRIGSGVTSYARLLTGLSDDQCLSLFHDLQREGRDHPAPTVEQRQLLLDGLRQRVRNDPTLTDARRRSIISRLDSAATQPMDGATYHAANQIIARAQASRASLNQWVSDMARVSGRSEDEIRSRLAASHADALESGRFDRAPRDWVNRMNTDPRYAHLPLSRATATAMHSIESEARERQAAATVPATSELLTFSGRVRSIEYYEVSGLAIVYTARTARPYRVSAEDFERSRNNPDAAEARWRRNPDAQWASVEQIQQARTMYRCASCGQYASAANGHSCPPRGSSADMAHAEAVARAAMSGRDTNIPAPTAPLRATAEDFTLATSHLTMPNADGGQRPTAIYLTTPSGSQIRNTVAANGSAEARITATVEHLPPGTNLDTDAHAGNPESSYAVTGNVIVEYDAETGRYEVTGMRSMDDERTLACSCPQYARYYHCPHVDGVVNAVANDINEANIPTAEQRAAAEAELAAELATPTPPRTAAAAPEPSISYANDPAAFQTAYDEAKAKWEQGENPIVYRYEDALGPMAAKGPGDNGRTFGLEIEYILPSDVDWNEANAAIAQDLYDAGLTSVNYQEEYHSAADEEEGGYGRGYTDQQQGGWRFEEDGSVAGELVSPIMYDTPESWQNLEKAIAILKRHGAVVNRDVGSHIHISTSDYGTVVGNFNRLGNMIDANEDTLMRLATNPFNGNTDHRTLQGSVYTTPMPFPAEGYRSVSHVAVNASGHSRHVNFEHADEGSGSRVEFRLWDGTLDPAVIQNNVRTSMALAEAAHNDTDYQPQPRSTMGTHRQARGTNRRMTGDQWRESTQSFREFLDTYFTRESDKKAAIGQFAMTRWQKARSGRW